VVKIFKNAAIDQITFEAAEQRPAMAHGKTVGFVIVEFQAPAKAAENSG
jgi:hypothetical protein